MTEEEDSNYLLDYKDMEIKYRDNKIDDLENTVKSVSIVNENLVIEISKLNSRVSQLLIEKALLIELIQK